MLLIHHLWKLNDGAPMNMVSGTTGLSGATDSSFVLRKSNGDRLICLRRADGVDDPLQRASPIDPVEATTAPLRDFPV